MRTFPARLIVSLSAVGIVQAQTAGQTLVTASPGVPQQQILTGVPQQPLVGTAVPVVPAGTQNPANPGTTAPTEEGWGGCVDPSNPDELVKIGKKTTICIVLADATKWNQEPTVHVTNYLRLSFQPKADEYSRFHVPDSYKDLLSGATEVFNQDNNNNVTIHVSSQNALSFQRMFYSPNAGAGLVFPFLTAIIDVQKGVVKGITWDDGCLFCSDDKCDENTYDYNGNLVDQKNAGQPTRGCHVDQTKCSLTAVAGAATEEEKPQCDVNVYFVWTGDDADGRAFQSSSFRFSAFPEQEIQNRVKDSLPDFPDIPNVFGGGDDSEQADGS